MFAYFMFPSFEIIELTLLVIAIKQTATDMPLGLLSLTSIDSISQAE
jgi:hypothetical protein